MLKFDGWQAQATLQAFSHFSYTHSEQLGWQCMVADVQVRTNTHGRMPASAANCSCIRDCLSLSCV